MAKTAYTHQYLIKIATNWILKNGYNIALTEFMCWHNEIPDVLAFNYMGESMLLECKVSRGDFLRDKNKESRRDPAKGLGVRRVYVCPKEVIHPEELPDKWGLLWVARERVYKKVYPKYGGEFKAMCQPYNDEAERQLLISALRHVGVYGKGKVIFKENRLEVF